MAGPLASPAQAVPGDHGDVTIAVDGSVDQSLDQQATSPVDVPGAEGLRRGVELRLRTRDLVLPNPAGPTYRAAEPAVRALGGEPVLGMDQDALRVHGPLRTYALPWYYMMDDTSIRPYHALRWDTGTGGYVAWGQDLWEVYAGFAAPGSEKAVPFGAMRAMVPDVRLQTAVEEIGLAATVRVVLHAALDGATSSGFVRPDAPERAEGAFALGAESALAAPALADAAASPVPAPAAAAVAGAAPPAAPQQAAPASVVDAGRMATAAVGAISLLAVAGYHLIRKSAILKNKVRSTIAEHVLRQPGSTITEIAQAVGVTHQTASYHLRLLQEHGLVLGVERGNKRLYFRNDGSFNQEERKYVAVLRDAESMRVLNLIRTNPWIMKNEAAAALGVSRNTLNWHLQKLVAAGLVSEARENGYCFLFCNRKASDDLLGTVAQKVEERRVDGPAAPPAAPAPPSSPGLFAPPPADGQHAS